MLEQFWVNLKVDLLFYRRNRLLLVVGLLFLVISAISATYSLVAGSATSRFDLVRSVFGELNEFGKIFTASLSLFLISSHLRNRNIKMVVTKPCLPETWLAAALGSAVIASAALFAVILGGTLSACLVWHIPYQSGFALVSIESFLQAILVMSYMLLLTLLMHPAVAVVVALLFNEDTFYGMRFALLTAIKATGGNPLLPIIEKITYAVYMVLPTFSPYAVKTADVHESLRASAASWKALASVALYALGAAALFFFLSVFVLRRKKLI
jgi:hypothetical protein